MGYNPPPTICWYCARSGYGNVSDCPWEREFSPVKGWDAKQTELRIHNFYHGKHSFKTQTSYLVKACPLFVKQQSQKELIHDDI